MTTLTCEQVREIDEVNALYDADALNRELDLLRVSHDISEWFDQTHGEVA